MQIVTYYSHLNGYEFLKVHKPQLWDEIISAIEAVDAESCKTKVSREVRTKDKLLYSPVAMNKRIDAELAKLNWKEERTSYWVTSDAKLIRRTINLTPAEQKSEIEAAGEKAFLSYNQTDFVKDRVAIEVQFGKYSFVAYDLFVKHMAFFCGR